MHKRVCIFALAAALSAVGSARAQTVVGVALTGTHGTHREASGSASAPFVPAPILGISHRFKQFELRAEGLPPIGPIGVANNGLGMKDVALTYADATLRYWNARGTFALGVGETLYDQRTRVLAAQDAFITETDTEMSRVVGTRYELAGHIRLNARDYVELLAGANPSMHGRFSFVEQTAFANGIVFRFTSRPEWETATQVDAGVRLVHAFGPYAVSYGLRYLNYTASYSERPWAP
ncbi:MAG TPA: hypothetical protein VJP85_11675, partial [Candidatus Baltobacteraceae bacterium]|nr:hypothetical protein [Candidatus Baltobacteraceae bacterium]